MNVKSKITYVLERRASFTFTIGSIMYGLYHLFNPEHWNNSFVYQPVYRLLGKVDGRHVGALFIILGTLKLIGLITDTNALKLPLYFALAFLWGLLSVCFLISFLQGGNNSLWIMTGMVTFLSTSILKSGGDWFV